MSIYDKSSLVLIPSGTKTGKVYSQVPVSGDGDFTFTRSSAATRVNADGFIEKETQNLLLYSSDQSNSAYNISSGISTPVAVLNPLTGINNAYKITKVSGHPDPYRGQSVVTSLNGCYTGSVWIWTDAGQPTDCELFLYNGDVSEVYTKPITITTTPTRYEFFVNFSSTAGQIRFRVDLSTSTDQHIYVYGYQIEQSLVARDYIETTTTAVEGGITDNVPRLDYTDSSCPALLLEPLRTNIAANSEYMLDFTKGSATSLEANAAISPEGKNNATYFYCNTTTTNGYIVQGWIGTSGVQYAVSFYAKAKELNRVYIKNVNDSGSQSYFDLSNGTFTLLSGIDSMSIEDAGNGWYRCTAVSTSTTTGIKWIPILKGDANEGVYVYGLQIEQASYPTSYIPTYGSSVTRVAEGSYVTSASDLIGQNEGTMFIDFDYNSKSGNNRFSLSDNSGVNWIFIATAENGSTNASRFYYRANNVVQIDRGSSAYFTYGQRYKLAFAYKSGDWAIYGNGTLLYSGNDTLDPFTLPLGQVNFIQANTGAADSAEAINQSLLFKTRLSNEELAALTTI